MLSTFKCPKLCATGRFPELNLEAPVSCAFGHGTNPTLRRLPKWICINSLTGECTNALSSFPFANMNLHRCFIGVHCAVDGLEELLKKIYASKVKPQSRPKPLPPVCPICLDAISTSPFGLFENCPHILCAVCLLAWTSEKVMPDLSVQRHESCPVCRTTSERVLLWPVALSPGTEKGRIFALQGRLLSSYQTVQQVPTKHHQHQHHRYSVFPNHRRGIARSHSTVENRLRKYGFSMGTLTVASLI